MIVLKNSVKNAQLLKKIILARIIGSQIMSK